MMMVMMVMMMMRISASHQTWPAQQAGLLPYRAAGKMGSRHRKAARAWKEPRLRYRRPKIVVGLYSMTSVGSLVLAMQATLPSTNCDGHCPVCSASVKIWENSWRAGLGTLFRSSKDTPSNPAAVLAFLCLMLSASSAGPRHGHETLTLGKTCLAKARMAFHRSKGTSLCRSHRLFPGRKKSFCQTMLGSGAAHLRNHGTLLDQRRVFHP